MQNVITIGRELIPVEQIAYVEQFAPRPIGNSDPTSPTRPLLNRETVLPEIAPPDVAEAQGFRLPPEDNVAPNPMVIFRVRSFEPTGDFNPPKPYQTRLMWRAPDGNSYSKLLLTKPEIVIAIVVRGETEPGSERKARPRPRLSRARHASGLPLARRYSLSRTASDGDEARTCLREPI